MVTTALADASSAAPSQPAAGVRLAVSSPTTPAAKLDKPLPAAPAPASSAGSSPAVAALQRLIAQLEKQLQREEQALKAAMAQSRPGDPASLTRVASAQAGVATTMGQLESAMQQMLQALNQQGSTSTGSLPDTQA